MPIDLWSARCDLPFDAVWVVTRNEDAFENWAIDTAASAGSVGGGRCDRTARGRGFRPRRRGGVCARVRACDWSHRAGGDKTCNPAGVRPAAVDVSTQPRPG